MRDALTSHAMQDMKENRLKILCETWVWFRRKLYLTDAGSKESPRDAHCSPRTLESLLKILGMLFRGQTRLVHAQGELDNSH